MKSLDVACALVRHVTSPGLQRFLAEVQAEMLEDSFEWTRPRTSAASDLALPAKVRKVASNGSTQKIVHYPPSSIEVSVPEVLQPRPAHDLLPDDTMEDPMEAPSALAAAPVGTAEVLACTTPSPDTVCEEPGLAPGTETMNPINAVLHHDLCDGTVTLQSCDDYLNNAEMVKTYYQEKITETQALIDAGISALRVPAIAEQAPQQHAAVKQHLARLMRQNQAVIAMLSALKKGVELASELRAQLAQKPP